MTSDESRFARENLPGDPYAMLLHCANRWPDKEALVFDSTPQRLTFSEWLLASQTLACALRRCGIQPGSSVALWAENRIEWPIAQVAVAAIGAVLGMLAALNVSAAISALEGLIGHKFLNADVYFIDYLPSQLQTQDVLMVCGAALVLSFLATLYPAWRAARTQPAQALRYE